MSWKPCLLYIHVTHTKLVQHLFLKWFCYYYSFAFHCNTISYHAVISNYQYGCTCFCASTLIEGQPCNMYSDSLLRSSFSVVDDLISSAVMLSGLSMHVSSALMVMFILGISSSLFVSWLCLGSQSTMNSCGLGLYRTLIMYWWMCSNILCGLCDKLAKSFFQYCHQHFAVCYHADLVWNSSDGISLGLAVYLGLRFWCCCIRIQC